ncbi:hypothetical protein D3C79_1014180 [compost metagenome]
MVKAVEVKFEAFGFDQVDAVGIKADLADGDLRQAVIVQPGEFIQRPDIGTVERQGVRI